MAVMPSIITTIRSTTVTNSCAAPRCLSIRGFLASLRHRVGRYPAVIVDGREKRIGLDFAAIDPLIDSKVAAVMEPGTAGR